MLNTEPLVCVGAGGGIILAELRVTVGTVTEAVCGVTNFININSGTPNKRDLAIYNALGVYLG